MNEGGQILILPSKLEEAGGLSSLIQGLSSTHKDTPSTQDSQDNKHENKETSSEDTVGGSPVALAYLLEGGVGSILNAGYFLHGVAAAYPPITNDIERIRASHGGLLGLPPLEFVENHPEVVEKIEKIILETYGQKGVEIYHKLCQNASGFYPRQGFEVGREIETLEAKPEANDQQTEKGERTNAPAKENVPEVKENVDNQGNPLNEDGTLKVEKINAIDELSDEDFSNPTRNVQLPALPQNVDNAIGANGKPVVIKKNIFKKNWDAHKFPFNESRTILKSALYNTDLVGQSQPSKKPFHWVAIKLDDKSPIVVLEVNENKDFTEIVGWYILDERNLGRIKRQAIKNGGELVMLSLKDKVESLSTPNDDLSTHKDTPSTPNSQAKKSKNNVAKKDKAITTSDLFPKVDNSKKLGKEISRQSAVTDKNVTLTRIDYENGYVCRVENKNGDFVEQAYNADGTPMSQALYNIGVDNNQFKEFIKQDKNGLYIKDKQLFEVLMQNTGKENAKPKSGTKKSVPKNEESVPKNEENAPKNKESKTKTKKSLRQHKAEQAPTATTEDTAMRDALADIMQQSGLEVFVDEKAQQVLDEVNGRGAQVRLQAKLSALSKAAKLIHNWIANKVQGRIFTIELPEATRRMIRNVMGRDFDSHNITIDGIRHGLKNHGVEGKKLNANSVPIREEDAELIPYIMTAPDYVRKGSEDVTGRESIRFYKTLSNGFVVVVEKEYKNSPNDMETINIWAEMSSEATNAQRRAVPDTNVQNAILSTDAAKIRKDAEDAIRKEEKLREHRVFHGSGAEFDAFDHSHMGEGEGAQAYGWGTYVTEVEGIGRAYARNPWQMKINELESNISRAKEKLPFMPPSDTKTELENNIKEWEEELAKLENGNRHLYTVEIPDDNGENYLHWEKPLTREQIVRITEKLKSGGWNVVDGNHPTFEKNGERIVLNERAQGRDVYAELEEALGSDKAASEFLSSVGFTGISYPAEYRSGGRNDGARNFVIFNESDAQITDHIRFFRTANGQAYGFTVNGKIYLDPRIATAETAIHEYAHLWADMLRQMNPEAWNDIVQLMKGTSVWDEVKSLYPELKTDDEIADEVLAHYSGHQGAAKLREEQHRIAHDQNMDLRSKATAIAALERIKQALTKFWKGVADLLHIRFTTAEEVADRILADLLHGVNPTAYAKREDGKVREQLIGEKGAAAIDKAEQATARLDNLNVAREMEQAFTEKKNRIEKLRKSEPLVVDGNEYLGKYELNSKSAGDYILSSLRRGYKNIDTNEIIHISRKSQKVAHHDAENEVLLMSIAYIPQLIEHAILIDEEPNSKSKNGFDSYRYYVVGCNIGGVDYTVRLTVGVKNGQSYYDHALTKIEKGNLLNLTNGVKADVSEKETAISDVKDKRLLSLLQMDEQENARKIKLATGWERGADGKWRYEIMDGELKKEPNVKEKVSSDGEVHYETTLGEILDNEQLYRSYPELRTLPVSIQQMDGGVSGIYLPSGYLSLSMGLYRHRTKPGDVRREIEQIESTPEYKEYSKYFEDDMPDAYIGREDEWEKAMDEAEAKFFESELGKRYHDLMWGDKRKAYSYGFDEIGKGVILHEVQHAIQHIEGFAQGGNSTTYREHLAQLKPKHDVWSWVQEFKDKKEELGSEASQDDVYYDLINEFKEDGYEFGEDFMPTREVFDQAFDLWVRGTGTNGYEAAFNEYQRLTEKFGLGGENNHYKQLSGEVEARNVQKRLHMTPEERRQSLAEETEDVAREDQIFIMDGIENANSLGDSASFDEHQNEDLKAVNERFNEQLGILTEKNADSMVFSLGRPSVVLQSAGVMNKPMKLYGNKVMKKMRKHGFALEELRDLPRAVADPIAVFNNYGEDGNRSILTELRTQQGNFLVTLSTGVDQDVDFNIVRSVFGKGDENVLDWINKGLATYINKEKALSFLSYQSAPIAATAANAGQSSKGLSSASQPVQQEIDKLDTATKVVKDFVNPQLSEENKFRQGANAATPSRQTVASLQAHAEKLVECLHLTNVGIVTDASQLEGKQRMAKGFYNKRTGKITIVLPNHASTADVEQTLLHEAVAHYGLRALFGKDFDTMLDRVYRAAGSEIHIPAHPHRVQQPGTANNRLLRQNHIRPQCQDRKTH